MLDVTLNIIDNSVLGTIMQPINFFTSLYQHFSISACYRGYRVSFLPCDLVVGQLELGQQDGAVLGPPAVNDADDLVTPSHRSHQPQIFNGALHRLKIQHQQLTKIQIINDAEHLLL